MLATNFSGARENLKHFCDQATDNGETIVVTRKNNKNVVLISLERLNQLEKAARNAEYTEKLQRGISALNAGMGTEHEIIEVY